jgi:hypothetical protein
MRPRVHSEDPRRYVHTLLAPSCIVERTESSTRREYIEGVLADAEQRGLDPYEAMFNSAIAFAQLCMPS